MLAALFPMAFASVALPRPRVMHMADDGIDDADLVARGRRGDSWALEKLYRRHVQLVAGTARRMLKSSAEVEDVVQETFMLAFEQLGSLEEPRAFRGWLVRIALSRVHRRFRFRRWLAYVPGFENDETGVPLAEEAKSDTSAEDRAELAKLDVLLQTLPEPVRMAWTLRVVLGCTNDEVATACGCSLATAKRRVSEAELAVRAHVGGGIFGEAIERGGYDVD